MRVDCPRRATRRERRAAAAAKTPVERPRGTALPAGFSVDFVDRSSVERVPEQKCDQVPSVGTSFSYHKSPGLARGLLPGVEDHMQIRPGLDFGKAELGGQCEYGGLGGRQVGLGFSESFDLGKVAQTVGPVERNFEGVPCSVTRKGVRVLRNGCDRAKPQEHEQIEQLTGSVLAVGEANLDLLAGLGGARSCAVLCR